MHAIQNDEGGRVPVWKAKEFAPSDTILAIQPQSLGSGRCALPSRRRLLMFLPCTYGPGVCFQVVYFVEREFAKRAEVGRSVRGETRNLACSRQVADYWNKGSAA